MTLTPATGYTGSISLLAALQSPQSDNTSFDTQPFTLSVNAATVPTAPTDLVANALATNEVGLTWMAPTSGTVTGYNVFRGTTAGGESTTPLNSTPLAANATSYNDLTAVSGTQYFYTVQAINSGESSQSSNEANATALTEGVTAPSAATDLTANAVSTSEIDLAFQAAHHRNRDGIQRVSRHHQRRRILHAAEQHAAGLNRHRLPGY